MCVHHTLKRKAQREVTNLHLDHPLLSGFTSSRLCAFTVKKNLFTNLNVHECMLDFIYVCVYVGACTPVLGVRSEDVTLWSFITSVTHSPLRSGTQRQCFIKE